MYPLTDNPNEKSTGSLNFTVPTGFIVKASGRRQDQGESTSRFTVNNATFFSFIAGRYQVIHGKGSIPVTAYVLQNRPNLDKYLEMVSRTVHVLANEFGEFPSDEFAVTEIPSVQSRKAGFNGASLDGFMVTEGRSFDAVPDLVMASVSHEVAHQWWPHVVNFEPALSFLIEALAQYGSLRTIEILQGEKAAERYRRFGDPSYSLEFSGLGYLKMAAAGFDNSLLTKDANPAISQRLAYNKGFFVWDMLSRRIGRERFRQVLHTIIRRYPSKDMSWAEFKRTLEEQTGRNLKQCFFQWFERTGAPDFELSWNQRDDILTGSIKQARDVYQAEIEMVIEGENNLRLMKTIEVFNERADFKFPVGFRVRSVVLDPQYKILRWTPEYSSLANEMVPLTRLQFNGETNPDKINKTFAESLEGLPVPDIYGARFLIEYGWALTHFFGGSLDEVKNHCRLALLSPNRRLEILPDIYLLLAMAAKNSGDNSTRRWGAESAITADLLYAGNSGVTETARKLLFELNRSSKN